MIMINSNSIKKNNKGFTLIELMIAMSVLAVLLLIATLTLMNLGRMYQKGTTQASLQDTTRNVISDVSSALQLSGNDLLGDTDSGAGAFCIGTTRYNFVKYQQVNDGTDTSVKHGLWRDTMKSAGSCPAFSASKMKNTDVPNDDSTKTPGQELIPAHMRLTKLNISKVSGGLYEIDLGIAYGDDDLLCNRDALNDCEPTWIANNTDNGKHLLNLEKPDGEIGCVADTGNQFCAVSNLSVSVVQRVASE